MKTYGKPMKTYESLWKPYENPKKNLWKTYGKPMKTYENLCETLWNPMKIYENPMKSYEKHMKNYENISPIISYFRTNFHRILHVFHGLPWHPKALPKSPRMPLWWRKIQGTQAGSCFSTICANGSVGQSGFWDGPAFRIRVICWDLQNHHVS